MCPQAPHAKHKISGTDLENVYHLFKHSRWQHIQKLRTGSSSVREKNTWTHQKWFGIAIKDQIIFLRVQLCSSTNKNACGCFYHHSSEQVANHEFY